MPVEDHKEHDDHFEDRLGEALRHAGGGFETDRSTLSTAGAARGRRLLLRRRAAVAGGVAAVALVGVGGTLLVPWGGDEDGRQSVAAGRAAPPRPAEDDGEVSAADLVRTLKKLLPAGKFSEEQGRGTGEGGDEAPPMPYAQVVYDDGKGGAAVGVSLNRIQPGSEQAREWTECPDKRLVSYDTCTASTLPDGSGLLLFQGYEYPDRRVDTKHWYASLVTPQGHHITVNEWNAEAEKDAPVTREEPPLTTAQLKDVVTAAAWRTAVDAIPEDPRYSITPKPSSSTSAPPGADVASVGTTLASLLPENMKVTAKGGQEPDYAYVVVDDGKGESMVQINVQSNMGEALSGHMAGAEELPDGTLLLTREAPDEKGRAGVVVRTVDVLRTNGDRVVIMASNAAGLQGGATREAPALTMDQLKRIATSAKWQEGR
ncbi:hypothetical protein [Streptomyces himalayensis]|uniref:Uncharacterized protein n=1 Tax=Streptomyces himalayensis subsp. himalayensis TaxID=2756131 RepID=A0A7W0DPX1_9ACTN|nr:hypothetical protein [Streptomyces himalayensis]MBA2949103.1 hypothetical protein [Streptomyces himalayensis subsp. himalayensis]